MKQVIKALIRFLLHHQESVAALMIKLFVMSLIILNMALLIQKELKDVPPNKSACTERDGMRICPN